MKQRLIKIVYNSREPEVRQLDDSIMYEKISRLNVSVNDIVLVYNFESVANLHQYVLDLVLTQSSAFGFHIGFEILLTILEEKVQVLFCFGRLVESNYVWTFELHQNFNLSSDDLLVFDVFQGDCFDGQQLVFIVLDVASINSTETAFS
jgi:hypothetical protein